MVMVEESGWKEAWRQGDGQLATTTIYNPDSWGMLFELRESAIREKLRIRSRKRKYAKLEV